jgi:hypothetical protein
MNDMQLIMEGWNRFLNEGMSNKLWIVAGPPGVGKTTQVLHPIESLQIPNLVTYDMDDIPVVASETSRYMNYLAALPKSQQYAGSPEVVEASAVATPPVNIGINDFISQNAGKDILLVGIAWLSPELPFDFPSHAEKFYLYRNPAEIIRDKMARDAPGKEVNSEDFKSAVADLEEENRLYASRGWSRMTSSKIVDLINVESTERSNA